MYIELLKKSFQQQFVYRTNTTIHVFTSFIYLFVTVNIWTALYRGKGIIDGISLKEMVTYVLMVQFVTTIVRLPVSKYVAGRASSGIISIDFIRPVNLKFCAIFDCLGGALFNVIVFVVPIVVLGSMMWGIVLPSQLYQWLLFVPSLFMAIILYSTMEYIMGLTAFWTKTDFHISWIVRSFMTLFSGSYIPLWFYPEPLKVIANFLPFQYFIFKPINIFMGKATFEEALFIILFQIIWFLILLTLECITWYFARKVVTVQGG
ncbi:ABC transporter permease [Mahella australiensis]|nr:ABC-2 family transporter protein [Mahella australiensis]